MENEGQSATRIKPSENSTGKSFHKRSKFRPLPDGFDYKNRHALTPFLTERFKILPRRITGLSAGDQRKLTLAIKRARHLAVIPYTSSQFDKGQNVPHMRG